MFVCPVSYQTTSITGNCEMIGRDVMKYMKYLGNNNGGFVGYIEDYHITGMSEENYQACIRAFETRGIYEKNSKNV